MIVPAPRVNAVPRAALALAMVLTTVFMAEHGLAIEPAGPWLAPSIKTLLALGALHAPLVLHDGEWHRLLTAPFLHADIFHLTLNAVVLIFAGRLLEPRIGVARFLAVFFAGALIGAMASVAANPPEMVAVGASGGIMALLAAAFVVSFRQPVGPQRRAVQWNLALILLPALAPLAAITQVDVAAHGGGAFIGTTLGLVMLRRWPPDRVMPQSCRPAALLTVLGTVAALGAFVLIGRNFDSYRLAVQVIPNDILPRTDQEADAQAETLIKRYPRDPRARMMMARVLINRDDLSGAESLLRDALADRDILSALFTRDTEWKLRAMLASVRLEQGDRAEARLLTREICLKGHSHTLRLVLITYGLCEQAPLQ